ncbi:MAG: Muropeptide transporter AmpG [Francisellaceae bacterium]|nr:Muropeptide transporter AmpG [Francisellaceae bacterium]
MIQNFKQNANDFFNKFLNKRILVTLILGFSSGLPLALTGTTLSTWFATTSISAKSLSLLTLVSFPYIFKFLWAPFLDRFTPPFLGRRRGWIVLIQMTICLVLASMAFQSPEKNTYLLKLLACFLAFFSASQDIVIDAYKREILREDELVFGAAMGVNGYRIAMLISGGMALIIADKFNWQITYLIMATLMLIGIVAAIVGPEPEIKALAPKNIKEAVIKSLIEFFNRPFAIPIILFIVLYKVGDSFAQSLIQPYLLREIKMSLTQIGTLVKGLGFSATIIGTLLGGILTPKLGFYKALLIFSLFHSSSYLAYPFLLETGGEQWVVGSIIFTENLANGLVMATFVGYLMSLCNRKFTAFQYALFSALSSISRVTIGPYAGLVVDKYGWTYFFWISGLLAIPGLIILLILKDNIENLRENNYSS